MTLTSRRHVLRSSALAIAAFGGCLETAADRFDDDEQAPEDAGELGAPAERVTVTINSQPHPEFDPQIVHVVPGGTVEWLVETGRHDVTAYHEDEHGPHRTSDGVEAWESDRLTGVGSSYERTFDQAGVYDYVDTQQVCTSHEIAGNIGRVVVGWPDPDDEPAMADPQPELPSQAARAIELFNEETRPVLEAGP
ncbi:halocyanin-like protein (copper-containing protein) 2 [Halobiforma lacisalsi AJ5]|uniref:Halocyanin-like protein (Copper-containing protein) 2 n=1 Tax=Natronobacterium lacisalsi AJ5 TaxID=358396 RepID=M0LDI4_NATLA|nr:plastocyanin/azurin family copper-binding protein [Halobiforma lacisalsi]EMA31178.1 halocyanin-like protein (copper-containing protein) 2 [Halobiforma lacisalsi AJ5]